MRRKEEYEQELESEKGLKVSLKHKEAKFEAEFGYKWDDEDTPTRTDTYIKKAETASAAKKRLKELQKELAKVQKEAEEAEEEVLNSSRPSTPTSEIKKPEKHTSNMGDLDENDGEEEEEEEYERQHIQANFQKSSQPKYFLSRCYLARLVDRNKNKNTHYYTYFYSAVSMAEIYL